MEFADVKPGQLLKIDKNGGLEVLTSESTISLMMDPFEFIRESNVVATVNGKSIYQIRKNIGKEQANFLSKELDVDLAFAEPDYTRPMTLGFSLEYQKHSKMFELAEGVIKDRYDDADPMIDFSEQVSKNKLLTTGRSLKFVIQNLVQGKKIATVQGTIQTGQHDTGDDILSKEHRRKAHRRSRKLCADSGWKAGWVVYPKPRPHCK